MEQFLINNPWVIWLMIVWSIPWKAVALWRSARMNKKLWFTVLLIVNTLGVLEILYIFFFSRKKNILD